MKRGLRVLFCLTVLALTASFIACKQPQSTSTSTSVVPVVFRAQQALEPQKVVIVGTIAEGVKYDKVHITAYKGEKKGQPSFRVYEVQKSDFVSTQCQYTMTMDDFGKLYTFDVKLVKDSDTVITACTISAQSGLKKALSTMDGTAAGTDPYAIVVKGALVDPAPAYEKGRVIAFNGTDRVVNPVSKADIAKLSGVGISVPVNQEDQEYTVIVELLDAQGSAVARTAVANVKSQKVGEALANTTGIVTGDKIYTIKVKGVLHSAVPAYDTAKVAVSRGVEINGKEIAKVNIQKELVEDGVEITVKEHNAYYTVVVELFNKGKVVARTTSANVTSCPVGKVFSDDFTGTIMGDKPYTILVKGTPLPNLRKDGTHVKVILTTEGKPEEKTYTLAEAADLIGTAPAGKKIEVNKAGVAYNVTVQLLDANGRVVAESIKTSTVNSGNVPEVYSSPTNAITSSVIHEINIKGAKAAALAEYDEGRITLSVGGVPFGKPISVTKDDVTNKLLATAPAAPGYILGIDAGKTYKVVVELLNKGKVIARTEKDNLATTPVNKLYDDVAGILTSTKCAWGIKVQGTVVSDPLPTYESGRIRLVDGSSSFVVKNFTGTPAQIKTAIAGPVEVEAPKAGHPYTVIVELLDKKGRPVLQRVKHEVVAKPISAVFKNTDNIKTSEKFTRGILVKGGADSLADGLDTLEYVKVKISLVDNETGKSEFIPPAISEVAKANVSTTFVETPGDGVEIEGLKENHIYKVVVQCLDGKERVVAETTKVVLSKPIISLFKENTGIVAGTTAKQIKIAKSTAGLSEHLPENYERAVITLKDESNPANIEHPADGKLTKAQVVTLLDGGVEVTATKADHFYTVIVELFDRNNKVIARTVALGVKSKNS